MDKIIPKFKGIKAYEEELATKSIAEENEVQEKDRPLKRKNIEIDPKLKEESNEKRLKSLKEKMDFDRRQQILVKEAIRSGKRTNKRIVFDNGFDDRIDSLLTEEKLRSNDNSAGNSKPKKAMNLFEDSDDEDIDGSDDNNNDFDFDKKINAKNAEKLVELNSRFAHDSRFRIDDRFFDKTDENEEEVDEVLKEKEKNLQLLEEVLGKKLNPIIRTTDKKEKKSNKNSKNELFISRFDPKNEKSSEYEVKSSSPEKKSNKKVSFDQKVLEKEEEKEVEVSKEVYYEVSEALKESLTQKEEEFSLTQMFGTSSVDDSTDKKSSNDQNIQPFHEKLDNKRKTDNTRNPFKYDSSSEEEADEEVVVKTCSEDKVKPKPNLNGFQFFFDKNDPRFDEDVFWSKELVEKARTNWKDRQIMIMRAMTVRKKSAKKNQKAKKKTFLKYQKNSTFRRFPNKNNKNDN